MRNCFHVWGNVASCMLFLPRLFGRWMQRVRVTLTRRLHITVSVPLDTARASDSTASRCPLMKETKPRHRRRRQLGMPPVSRACVTARDTRNIRRGRAHLSDTPTRTSTARDTAAPIAPSPGPTTPTIRRRSQLSTPDRTRRDPIPRSRSR